MGLFNFDNVFFRGMNKLVDCVYVSFLWLICCIPIFTIGASTSALYYTVHKSIRGGRAYVGRSFFHAFRQNFKQATLSWLVMLLVLLVLIFDAWFMREMLAQGEQIGVMFYVYCVGILFAVGWGCYMFPYVARFENTVKATLKNAVLLELRHLPWSLLLILLSLLEAFLIWLIWPLIFILPAFIYLVFNEILERIFRRYMSEEDLKREMEIEQEDKRESMMR